MRMRKGKILRIIWVLLLCVIMIVIDIKQHFVHKTKPVVVNIPQVKLQSRPIDLFLKQLTRSQRFERNDDLREVMKNVATRLSDTIRTQYVRKKNLLNDVTLLLNAVNEIKDFEGILKDLELKSSLKWVKSIHIVIGITEPTLIKHSDRLSKLKAELPNLNWITPSTTVAEKLSKTLHHLLANYVNTNLVLFSRNLRYLPNNSLNMANFIRPLGEITSDIVGGSSVYPDGTWHLGCYQSKLIWSQYKVQNGFDTMYGRDWLRCDTIDGPFVARKNLIVDFLKEKPNMEDYLLYLELFYVMTNEKRIMLVHPGSVFHTQDTRDSLKLSRDQVTAFMKWHALGNIISETFEKVFTHYEFGFLEVNIRCSNKGNMLRPRPCMRELHYILIKTFRVFHEHSLEYMNDEGSLLAGIKLGTSLPWDLDQDFLFQTNNFTELVKHENEFKKFDVHLAKELDKPCMKEKTKEKNCGYVGFRDWIWRMECWGQYYLFSDYYRPHKVPDRFKGQMFPSRIFGNPTLVKMEVLWTVGRPNPGLFSRRRYGTDVLRHAKHWMNGGAKDFLGHYATSSHFGKCREEGHHECLNQYLADGNIQFQRVWA